jgi:hypothetical protein
MAVTHDSSGLFRDPYGLEHPYEQTATERFPQDPVADQSVELCVAILSPVAADAVRDDWTVQGVDSEGKPEGHAIQA